MKKLFWIFMALGVLSSCGDTQENDETREIPIHFTVGGNEVSRTYYDGDNIYQQWWGASCIDNVRVFYNNAFCDYGVNRLQSGNVGELRDPNNNALVWNTNDETHTFNAFGGGMDDTSIADGTATFTFNSKYGAKLTDYVDNQGNKRVMPLRENEGYAVSIDYSATYAKKTVSLPTIMGTENRFHKYEVANVNLTFIPFSTTIDFIVNNCSCGLESLVVEGTTDCLTSDGTHFDFDINNESVVKTAPSHYGVVTTFVDGQNYVDKNFVVTVILPPSIISQPKVTITTKKGGKYMLLLKGDMVSGAKNVVTLPKI